MAQRSECRREATAPAYAVLDAFIYGFAVQEASLPFEGPGVSEVAEPVMERMAAGEYPHMTDMAVNDYLQPGYDFADEFEFGLTMLLDGLSKLLPADIRAPEATGSDTVCGSRFASSRKRSLDQVGDTGIRSGYHCTRWFRGDAGVVDTTIPRIDHYAPPFSRVDVAAVRAKRPHELLHPVRSHP